MYAKAEMFASLEGRYNAYMTFYKAHKYDMALDALVCGKGRCENYRELAKQLKCEKELTDYENQIDAALQDSFGVSPEQAKQWYNIGDWNQYSIEIYKKVRELGLLES